MNVVRKLEEHGAMEYTTIVAASASDSGRLCNTWHRMPAALWVNTSAIAVKMP